MIVSTAQLADRFAQRGGGRPTLLRHVSAPVWSDGRQLVAKWHSDRDQGRTECAAATRAYAAGVPLPQCLDGEDVDGGLLTWWQHVTILGPAAPTDAGRWLRQLHDHADPTGLPPAAHAPDTSAHGPEAAALADRLHPWLARADQAAAALRNCPRPVLVHGDANPTNLVTTAAGTVGLDFGAAGVGARALDVATVCVLAVETGTGSATAVHHAYGPHPDLTDDLLAAARVHVAVSRAAACLRIPAWLNEGWERLHALDAGRPYRFGPNNGPK